MTHQFIRTKMLLKDDFSLLLHKHVAVFGIGGVGGSCVETLVRSGITKVTIIDNDVISESNLNRQIIALHSTIGKRKVDVMKARLLDINPNLEIQSYPVFILQDTIHQIDFSVFDYIVDAIDTVSAKLLIIEKAYELKIPVISSMGAGNRLDPTKLTLDRIENTSYCPLAKVMRRELKKRRIRHVRVLYSKEQPIKPLPTPEATYKQNVPGSVAFVANAAGILIASDVIRTLTRNHTK